MSSIDRQRITAVRKLEELGYTFANGEWAQLAIQNAGPSVRGDALYVRLVMRAVRIRPRPPCASTSDSADSLQLMATGDRTALCLEIGRHRSSR
jgi:hypothetical protein